MPDENRQSRRIEKSLTIQFCLVDEYPQQWDMYVIENISAGGIRFIAPSELELIDKTFQLRIKIPELAPVLLELEAVVLGVMPRINSKYSDVRAKFINLSEANKEHLSIVEKMIDLQKIKNAKKDAGKIE
jgi:hypothetical protein